MPVFSKDEKNYLFVHIPKAAGTTIEEVFDRAGFTVTYKTKAGTPVNKVTRCTPQHFHAELLSQVFKLSKFDAIFTIVRDPYARIRSEYAWRHKNKEKLSADVVCEWLRNKFRLYPDNKFVNDNHIRPQVEFILPGSFVFRLEDGLETIFTSLREKIGIDISYEPNFRAMVSEKTSGHSSQDVELNDEAISLINTFYEADFRVLEYATIRSKNEEPASSPA